MTLQNDNAVSYCHHFEDLADFEASEEHGQDETWAEC